MWVPSSWSGGAVVQCTANAVLQCTANAVHVCSQQCQLCWQPLLACPTEASYELSGSPCLGSPVRGQLYRCLCWQSAALGLARCRPAVLGSAELWMSADMTQC